MDTFNIMSFFTKMLGKMSSMPLELISSGERNSYSYATTQYMEPLGTSPKSFQKNGALTQSRSQPTPAFLHAFLAKLPQEIRDIVYAYIIGYTSSTYTIQPHSLFFRQNIYLPTTPIHIIPATLTSLRHPIAVVIIREIAIHLLSLNTFFLRYRYDSRILDTLSTDTKRIGCVPGQFLRKLQVMIRPPESAEDESHDDEEIEFQWRCLFPKPKNAKCAALRHQLEDDLKALTQVVGEKCHVEVLVFVDYYYDELVGEKGVMKEWLVGTARKWAKVGRCVDVKIVEADFSTRDLVLT